MANVLFYLLAFIALWILGWYLVYLLTGFHIRSITINNGILCNGISYRLRKLSLSIRSARFRLWGNSRMLIIDCLEVKIAPKLDKSAKRAPPKPKPLKLYTTRVLPRNSVLRFISAAVILRLPALDVELRRAKVVDQNRLEATSDYARLTVTSRLSNRDKSQIKYRANLIVNNSTVDGASENSPVPSVSLANTKVQTGLSLNLRSGEVSRVCTKVFLDELNALVFKPFKYLVRKLDEKYASDKPLGPVETAPPPPPKEHEEKLSTRLERLVSLHNCFYAIMEDISLNIQNLKVTDIPFVCTGANQHSYKDYLSQTRPSSSLTLKIKSLAHNYVRLKDGAAGFEVLFDPKNDKPFHLSTSVQLVTVDYMQLARDKETGREYMDSDEVLIISNQSFNLRTNAMDYLARGDGFKNSAIEVFSSASGVVMDVDSVQLLSIIYNGVLIGKFMKVRKLRQINQELKVASQEHPGEVKSGNFDHETAYIDSDDSYGADTTRVNAQLPSFSQPSKSSALSRMSDRIFQLLEEYYPRLDFKLIIEQPRFIIRNVDIESKRIEILNFSYSLLNVHVITTEERDYDAKCHILHPSLTYHEKSGLDAKNYVGEVLKTEMVGLRSAHLQVDILKNLKVRSFLDIDEIMVNLAQLDVLAGTNKILRDITTMADYDFTMGIINLYLNSEIIKLRSMRSFLPRGKDDTSKGLEKVPFAAKIFRTLPDWFLETEVRVSDCNFVLGSRSLLIPRDLLAKTSEGFENDTNGTFHDLRTVNLVLESAVFKAKNPNVSATEAAILVLSNSSTLGTLTPSSDHTELFWLASANITRLKASVNLGFDEALEPLFDIPSLCVDTSAVCESYENKFKVNASVDNMSAQLDRYKIFAVFGVIHLLKEAILGPIKSIQGKLRKDLRSFSSDLVLRRAEPKQLFKDFFYLSAAVHRVNIAMHLSDDFKMMLQIFDLNTAVEQGVATLTNHFLRLLVDSPKVPSYWNRILLVDGLKVVANDPSLLHLVSLDADSFRIVQPHGFVVHHLFDNLSVMAKIVKYLVHSLKSNSPAKRTVEPSESKALDVPKIKVMAKKLSFNMEDDPFESELSMIYQLGIIEQRKRLEQLAMLESKQNLDSEDEDEYEEDRKLQALYYAFSKQWIRKVTVYKLKLNEEISKHKKFIFGNEAVLNRSENEGIVAYSNQAPLLSVILSDLNLDIQSTKFSLKELPQFVHDLGQGVPLDTRYSLQIPTYVDLKVTELRMHMRDYPLPLFHLPRDTENKTLWLRGHLVISENLVRQKENLRRLHVALAPGMENYENDKYYALTLEKSLSIVKLYTDLKVTFGSTLPGRFVWGQSYQFGIQQMMLNFDQFSKPPVDSSRKLGFWDKLRLIMHGKFDIESGPNSGGVEVAFKGSRDPYDLFDVSLGFVLSFKDNLKWKVNEHDDLLLFFNIEADNVSWYIPNYLTAPLLAWTRPSSKYVFFPNKNEFLTSCFGYYLGDSTCENTTAADLKNQVIEKQVITLKGGVGFQVGFLLQRKGEDGKLTNECRPHYEIELFNPEYTDEGHDSYEGFRSDRVHMSLSFNAHRDTSYNAIRLSPGVFKHFFSWWKLFSGNMMLPVRRGPLFGELKSSAKFSQHLYTIKFLFKFKSLFISHIYRDETVDVDDDKIECVGVRAKVDDFLVDLHQRKEPRIEVHEGLSRNKKIMKMNFNVGEVHLSGIDLRTVFASFQQSFYVQSELLTKKPRVKVFDNDQRWFDIEDYEEAYVPSLAAKDRTVDIYPLMYSKRFSYLRSTEKRSNDEEKALKDANFDLTLGTENTHDCSLETMNVLSPQIEAFNDRIEQLQERIRRGKGDSRQVRRRIELLRKYVKEFKKRDSDGPAAHAGSESETENFHNKFMLISMFWKWNGDNRNLLLKYIHFVQLKSYMLKYLSHESVSTLDDIIAKMRLKVENDDFSSLLSGHQLNRLTNGIGERKESSEERLANFDAILRRVAKEQGIVEDYRFEVISPQIQLQNSERPDSVVIILAPSIDGKIVSVVDTKESHLVLNSKQLENRYGLVLKDANIFVIDKEDTKEDNLIFDTIGYGSKSNWPPWFGIEISKDCLLAGKERLLVEKTSMMVTYDQIKPLGSSLTEDGSESDSEAGGDKQAVQPTEGVSMRLHVDVPTLVVTCTSKQYFTLYLMVLNLLFYAEPLSKSLTAKLEKLKFSIDFQDLGALRHRLESLQKYYRLLTYLTRNYNFRQRKLTNEDLNDYLGINFARGAAVTDVYLMMKSILLGDLYQDGSNSQPDAEWAICADQVILHMLEDDRTPILDVAIAQGKFKRLVKEDGSNDNRIEIEMMQGFNLIPNAHFQSFLEPLNKVAEHDNLINVDWSMNRSVGGIKVMENFAVLSQPLNLRIDQVTGEKLMKYIFQTDVDDLGESPLLDSDSELARIDELEEDVSTGKMGFVEQLEGVNQGGTFDKESENGSGDSDRNRPASLAKKLSLSSGSKDDLYEYNVEEMVARSKKYYSIISFRFSSLQIMVSIKLTKGYTRLFNVEDFMVSLPELVIEGEIMSMLDVTMAMKKLVMKTLVSHVGRLLRNKLTIRQKKVLEHRRLKPLRRYARFTKVSELADTDNDTMEG